MIIATWLLSAFRLNRNPSDNFPSWEIVTARPTLLQTFSCGAAMQKSQYSRQYRRLIQALRQSRDDAGLTQLDVAQRLGTYASYVSKCESGERRIDVVELAAFCRLYGVSLSDFLDSVGLK